MRLMQLVIRCPWPPQSGSDFRAATLADQDVATDFLSLGLATATVGDVPQAVGFEPLRSFPGGNPWRAFDRNCPTCLGLSPATLAEIDGWVERFRPDTVVLEGVAWGPVLRRLKSRGITTVLNMHNIESALYEQQLRAAAWPKRVLRRVTARRRLAAARAAVRAADRDLSRLADRVWVCSTDDANALRALGGRADDVIANPIPDEASLDVPISAARYENPVPVFIGQLCYFPNVKAIVELVGGVVPALAKERGEVVPVVAGRPPVNRAVARLAAGGRIRLIENPPSCREILAAAGYTLLPIRHGSGTRLKVLEALAAGVVVIATGRAVEGLGLVDGTHYLRAETSDELARRLAELLRDTATAERIARHGRRFVIDHYTREVIGRAISTALVEARRSTASAAVV